MAANQDKWPPQKFFSPTLRILETAFRRLEAKVPPPKKIQWQDGYVFRYSERTIQQAIIQKLARTLSGLHALDLLLTHGLHQELGILQRTLDEIGEDIAFLALAVIRGEITERHLKYLDYFYAEEFEDPENAMTSHSSRPMIDRKKIRAYINSDLGPDATRANIVGNIITKSYSGFVHAASPHIMDMYGQPPINFDVSGRFSNLRGDLHANDALNYFLRGLFAMAYAAKAFGDEVMFDDMRKASAQIEATIEASKKA